MNSEKLKTLGTNYHFTGNHWRARCPWNMSSVSEKKIWGSPSRERMADLNTWRRQVFLWNCFNTNQWICCESDMLPSRGDQVKPCSLRVFLIIFEVTFAVIKIENELSFPFTILPNAVIGLRILFFDRTALYDSQ